MLADYACLRFLFIDFLMPLLDRFDLLFHLRLRRYCSLLRRSPFRHADALTPARRRRCFSLLRCCRFSILILCHITPDAYACRLPPFS